ncbi:MAG TPA: winged helix-turn-helix transcriptional regulator [Polyangiaceae bacterium]|nr:winged helix-turn-helix transcriptional regulator [Polyangiaceae bacterium]
MQNSPALSVLDAIFLMSAETLPITRSVLARRLGLTGSALQQHLLELERRGFIDGRRLRLTLPGLALAVSMRRRRAQPTRAAA